MEKIHSSRSWRKNTLGSKVMARSDYSEVLGGSLRSKAAPFSLQLEDYLEIFGSAASASSIPLLDLPPADNYFETEGHGAGGCRGGVDYSDVFGMFGGGGFAASYEELFPEPKRSGVSSSEGRTLWDVFPEQQEKKAIEHPVKEYNEHDTNSEMNQSSPVARHSYDVSSKQFKSHHRTSWEPLNVVISEKVHEAKHNAIPKDFIVPDTNDTVPEMTNKTVLDEAAPHFFSSAKTSPINLKFDATPSESDGASLLVVSGDEKHYSQSSSYHSASSGDISLDDVTFLEVSEISLQTEPLQGPPPSRSPPEPSKKEVLDVEEGIILKSVVNNQMGSRSEANSIHNIKEPMKDISFLHDTEMDPHSAVALSLAAVKEAMEQAQARLKSAKELMDRKRERCRRMNGKEDTSVMDVNNLSDKSKMFGECTFVEKDEIRTEGKTSLNHEEITVQLHSYRNDQQMMNDFSLNSSEVDFKTAEIPGKWREKKFCELTQNDRFFNTVIDNYIQEGEMKEKTAICSGKEKENDSKDFIKASDVEGNHKSMEVSFSMEKVEEDNNSNCSDMAFTEEANSNLVDASMDEFLLEDSTSKLEDAFGSHLSDGNQKMSDAREDKVNDNKISKLNSAVDYCLHKVSEKCSQNCDLVFKHVVDNEYCEERQSKVSEGVPGYVECERKFSPSYLPSEIKDSYKEVRVPNETLLQDIFVKEITLPDELFTCSTTDKKQVAEELKSYVDYENEKNTKHQYSDDEFRCNIEKSDSAAEKSEGEGLQIIEETLISEENELEQEVIQNENGLENLGMVEQTQHELDPISNCRSGCPRDCNKNESKEFGTSLHRDEKSMAAFLNQEVETFDFLESSQRVFDKISGEKTTEATVPYKPVEKQISLSSADKTCQVDEIEESDTKVFLSTKEGNLLAASEVCHTDMAENHEQFCREDDEHRRKMNIDRERIEEQAIRLEVKKESEREKKEKILTEQANYEARQKELAEAQKRAERIAVERATAEARQRALVDAREKAKKAVEAEKASREARLRAERAAVERATEEARRRAIEKALAEKAAAGARERTSQVSFSNKDRMRKDNGTAHFKATHIKEDSETRHKSNSAQIPRNAQSQTATCSTNGHMYSDSSNNGGTESSVKSKAGQEKQQQTAERAAQTLSEKNMRDILAQREQAERDRLAESVDVLVRKWSNGKDGNLRLLLSTLQNILSPESGWQPIPLADIINVPAVKKAYRKATLCVHPDKLQQRGATIQQKYICEKVFDLLKEAWEKFNSVEQ